MFRICVTFITYSKKNPKEQNSGAAGAVELAQLPADDACKMIDVSFQACVDRSTDNKMEDDWAQNNSVLHKDCFISSAAASSDNDMALHLATFDPNDAFDCESIQIKMEPSDETSDYHGSSSGSPSSSLSSPNNFKDEPLGLDINFCGGAFTNTNFSPAPGSSHSPVFGIMNGGQVSQQHSPLPPVAHFSHTHLNHQMTMHHGNPAPPQYIGPGHHHQQQANQQQQQNGMIFNDSLFYEGIVMNIPSTANIIVKEEIKEELLDDDGEFKTALLSSAIATSSREESEDDEHEMSMGGVDFLSTALQLNARKSGIGLAAAQQQLKSRTKMHEMAVRQKLITDQNLNGNGDVQLSAEERRTLIQEGYEIPSRLPLTKSEEEALKIVRRKIKNKLSAQESRRKRKEYLDALEVRLQGCVQENGFLKSRLRALEQENHELKMRLHQYEEGSNGGQAQQPNGSN
ncbi:unnamed protein product [Caenorhabditis bovis]|uniref:BZIP domain-containing protein n=1 Tax=Caenorhabditis bovis TaxID=2654633 RepID=A0A8S1FDG2_9PELO|nr:unnamed protein product [Caenorhabditis bovis]